MSEQLSLLGFASPAPARDRLFFALLPDVAAASRIADLGQALRGEHGLKGRLVATDRLHVTLHFLGDYPGLPTDIVAKASAAAAGVEVAPFHLAFDRVMSFANTPRNRPLVLRGGDGLGTLIQFQQTLSKALASVGLPNRSGSSYTPHVTLLYDDQTVAEQEVGTVGWTVREFVLIHSVIGEGRYVPIGRWSLR